MMPPKRFLLYATFILLGAAFLRLYTLHNIPPGLHFDEGANGVIVRDIAFGNYRPIFITAYTGKEVLWFYTAALTMRLIGPTVFALRLTSALFGTVTVAVAGWLVRSLYRDDPRRDGLALLTMAALAIAFWHLVLSRFADRAVTQPLLQGLSLGMLWMGLRARTRRRQLGFMALAGAFAGLAAYTYLAVRLFPIPLAITLLVFVVADKQRVKRLPSLAVYGVCALAILAPLGVFFLQNPAAFSTRIDQVAPRSLAEAAEGWRLALGMFFFDGDPLWRFNLPGKPMFGPLLGVFFVIGIGVALVDLWRARISQDRARGALLLVWPLVMLAPTALSTGGITPSNLRAAGLAPLIALYPALGLVTVGQWYSRVAAAQSRRVVPVSLTLILVVGGGLTLRDMQHWGVTSVLYYDNDSHVAALADYLNDHPQPDATAYLATFHYRHPTLGFLAHDEAQTRSLFGGDALVMAASGSTLEAYTRDALPPTEWDGMLDSYRVADPPGRDGSPDFVAYLLPPEFDPEISTVPSADFAHVITLLGANVIPAQSGTSAAVDLLWQIEAAAPAPDYAFVAEICDAYDWCWVKANLDGSLERGVNATYTSEEWSPGERLLTRIDVPIPQGAPPGTYTVRVSIFSSQADGRLPMLDASGGFAGFQAEVGPLAITANPRPELEDLPIQFPAKIEAAPGVALLGYDLPQTTARPGERIHLAAYWHNESEHLGDLPVILRLGDIVLYEGNPVHDSYPVTDWQVGELITDRYAPRLPRDLEAGTYPLTLQLGNGDRVHMGEITIEASTRTFDPPDSMIPLAEPAVFGDRVSLLGYEVGSTTLTGGEVLTLRLIWRAEGEIGEGYTVFIHVVDAQGNIVVQDDRAPVANGEAYPTDLWDVGEVVIDEHTILIPEGTPPGDVMLRVGLYLPETAQRLSLPDDASNVLTLPITLTIR